MASEIIAMLHEVLPEAVVAFIVIAAAISVTIYKLQNQKQDILKFIKSIQFIMGLILSAILLLIFLFVKSALSNQPSPLPAVPTPSSAPISETIQPEPSPTAAPFAAGQYVAYGSYPQSNDFPSPITWIILSAGDDRLLLISQYVLDARYFGQTNEWQHSELRDWLNSTFLDNAFTGEDQALLLRNSLNNFITVPTVADTDMLSIKTTQSTQYAKNMGALPKTGNSAYITQTPKGDELIYCIGSDGKVVQMYPELICGVRPMIMIDVSKMKTSGGGGTASNPWIIHP